jgi:hypothetical protein
VRAAKETPGRSCCVGLSSVINRPARSTVFAPLTPTRAPSAEQGVADADRSDPLALPRFLLVELIVLFALLAYVPSPALLADAAAFFPVSAVGPSWLVACTSTSISTSTGSTYFRLPPLLTPKLKSLCSHLVRY